MAFVPNPWKDGETLRSKTASMCVHPGCRAIALHLILAMLSNVCINLIDGSQPNPRRANRSSRRANPFASLSDRPRNRACRGKSNHAALRQCSSMLEMLIHTALLIVIDYGADYRWGTLCNPPNPNDVGNEPV
jgi:hypothetical protein